ncbi:MAG TPA: cupredoxin domain-containing protein [Polyangiaceae bacterium]|nr:cupredoxin domain-containing protein [Polyangiaceae bacterium]
MNFIRPLTLCLVLLGTACDRSPSGAEQTPTPTPPGAAATELSLNVDASGYHPDKVSAPAGRPVRLTVTRTSDEGCGQQITFPSLAIRKDLPLHRPVSIDLTMPASGELAFTCGMNMLRGSIVAE